MTFFANTGITWPELKQETLDAGAASLQAASLLWRVFAGLEYREMSPERRELEGEIRKDLSACAESLRMASKIYRRVADKLQEETLSPLTPAELDLASLRAPFRYDGDPLFDLYSSQPRISVGALYLELSQRTANLAAAVATFEIDHGGFDLAPQVFQMMRQWEALAALGRVVAVLNRRRNGGS